MLSRLLNKRNNNMVKQCIKFRFIIQYVTYYYIIVYLYKTNKYEISKKTLVEKHRRLQTTRECRLNDASCRLDRGYDVKGSANKSMRL